MEVSFEKALDQLQVTVKKLESGELTLDDALKSFEEGVRLARICQEKLTAAEQKVDQLTKINSEGKAEVEAVTPSRS